MAKVSGWQVRGKPGLCWMDGVTVALGSSGISEGASHLYVKDRKEWRSLTWIFLLGFFRPPFRAQVDCDMERCRVP